MVDRLVLGPSLLVGVCVIASGLTFLETIANPYTTVLGRQRYAATRINLAQSCNGIGWIFGPIVGGMFFYSIGRAARARAARRSISLTSASRSWSLVLAVIFYFANVPDIKTEDDYHLDDADAERLAFDLDAPALRRGGRGPVPLRRRPGRHLQLLHQLHDLASAADSGIVGRWHCCGAWLETGRGPGVLRISDKGPPIWLPLGFICFLVGRFTGAGLLKKFSAHKVLGLYGLLNVVVCLLIFLKLGWLSVACVF